MSPLFRERWYPTAVAAVVCVVWWWGGKPWPPADAVRDLLATSMSLASITVGFLATAMSIIAASPDNSLLRQLRQSNYMDDLMRYLHEPFVVGIFFAALSLVGFFCSTFTGLAADVIATLWILCAASLLVSMQRIGSIFVKFLRASAKSSPSLSVDAAGADTPAA